MHNRRGRESCEVGFLGLSYNEQRTHFFAKRSSGRTLFGGILC